MFSGFLTRCFCFLLFPCWNKSADLPGKGIEFVLPGVLQLLQRPAVFIQGKNAVDNLFRIEVFNFQPLNDFLGFFTDYSQCKHMKRGLVQNKKLL